jgi:hypothetical protein
MFGSDTLTVQERTSPFKGWIELSESCIKQKTRWQKRVSEEW